MEWNIGELVDNERMRTGHWLGFGLVCHWSPRVLPQNSWRKKTEEAG